MQLILAQKCAECRPERFQTQVLTDIGKTIHPHPTLGESIGMAAEKYFPIQV